MPLVREEQRFPTRNYPYRLVGPGDPLPPDIVAAPPAPNVLHRRVLGVDAQARPMTPDELELLADPCGRLLRSGQPFPLTLRDLLAALDRLSGTTDELPDQLVFLAADGGHIPWSQATDQLQRTFRFVVARGKGDFRLLVSSSTTIGSSDDAAFLQVIGWDPQHEVFHYYERLFGTFFWAGQSHHALDDASRGRGPFDSHVNGSLVMKELRSPWIHWHAPQAGINATALAPADHLRNEPLFVNRVTAERLETEVVRPGIRRWNDARVRKAVDASGVWRNVRHFLRQVVTDTTVNLATSETASSLVSNQTTVRPPLSFFVNRDILFDTLGFEPDDPALAQIDVPGAHYRACLDRYDVHRSDGTIRVDGDVHFAFLTPEPAFEDTQLADRMLQAGLLSRRFLACLSMTDFANPVFSARRASLLRYAPEEVTGAGAAVDLETQFVDSLTAAMNSHSHGAADADSPEREFLDNWNTTDFEDVFRERLTEYLRRLQSGMTDPDVVDSWFRLAEYRRRRFRGRKLAEFALTTPRTAIPENAPPLRMTSFGRVEET